MLFKEKQAIQTFVASVVQKTINHGKHGRARERKKSHSVGGTHEKLPELPEKLPEKLPGWVKRIWMEFCIIITVDNFHNRRNDLSAWGTACMILNADPEFF